MGSLDPSLPGETSMLYSASGICLSREAICKEQWNTITVEWNVHGEGVAILPPPPSLPYAQLPLFFHEF